MYPTWSQEHLGFRPVLAPKTTPRAQSSPRLSPDTKNNQNYTQTQKIMKKIINLFIKTYIKTVGLLSKEDLLRFILLNLIYGCVTLESTEKGG